MLIYQRVWTMSFFPMPRCVVFFSENDDFSKEPLRIPLNGSALRPWCHFEVGTTRWKIAWFWAIGYRYRILWPYGWKDPPNIIYICDIYIYICIYLYLYIYICILSFGYVYVMFECLARCTCKFTQPHTCITSFHRLRNKQMNEWKKERKRKKERINTHAHIMYIYIYRSIHRSIYIYMKIYRLYVGC